MASRTLFPDGLGTRAFMAIVVIGSYCVLLLGPMFFKAWVGVEVDVSAEAGLLRELVLLMATWYYATRDKAKEVRNGSNHSGSTEGS